MTLLKCTIILLDRDVEKLITMRTNKKSSELSTDQRNLLASISIGDTYEA